MFISVKVITSAAKNEVVPQSNGEILVKVTASREKGRANKRVIEMLAERFNVAKSAIKIIKGQFSQRKIIVINKQ